jgi:hypothetical protein
MVLSAAVVVTTAAAAIVLTVLAAIFTTRRLVGFTRHRGCGQQRARDKKSTEQL